MDGAGNYGIALHFDGSFVHGKTVTVRTLAHSLSALQRMIDKAVLYEKKGAIKKYDALPAVWYDIADLTVQPFEDGCVKIPLVGLTGTQVICTLKDLLQKPFEVAVSHDPIDHTAVTDGIANAINRAVYGIGLTTHEQLIADAPAREKRYFAEAIFREFDTLISPLRSSSITDEDFLSLELRDEFGSKEYEFDKRTSTRFHRVVSSKQLGPTVAYSGRLIVFGENKSKDFPYFGKFYSFASKQEHKLLVTNDDDAGKLRSYNVSGVDLHFRGAPVTAWGAFDERRGDIVFLTLNG
jgi:hypothetical protein